MAAKYQQLVTEHPDEISPAAAGEWTKSLVSVDRTESYSKNVGSVQKPPAEKSQSTSKLYNRSASPIPPLLRSASSLLRSATRLPPGSLRASTFTVITGMVGGGTFTFSYGIYKAGMIPALIYLVLIASLAAYSTHAIVYCAERNNCPSFRTLAKKLYNKQIAVFVQVCLLLLLWMACISYLTLTKNLLSTAVSKILNDHDNAHWYDNKILLLLLASILPTFLALQRRVSALRYSSLLGLITVLFVTILVVTIYFRKCDHPDSEAPGNERKCFEKSITDTGYMYNHNLLDHSYTIAIFFGGFAAQFTILPIYFEMQKRSPRNMTKCISSGFGFTFGLYLIVAYFGYWTYPLLNDAKNDQNLITLYKNDEIMLVSQILLALYVMVIIPLFAHAFRKSVAELIATQLKKKKHDRLINEKDEENGNESGTDEEDEDERVNDAEIIEDAIVSPHLAFIPVSPEAKKIVEKRREKILEKTGTPSTHSHELPTLWHAIVTMSFLITAFGVATVANNIGEVNSIIGSTTLPVVCFIFPAMCAYRTDTASFRMKVITICTACFSVFNAIMFFYNLFAG